MVEMKDDCLKQKTPLHEILKQASSFLDRISDEVGEEDIGEGYLLKYEGWGPACVDTAWPMFEALQGRRDIRVDGEQVEEDRECALFRYAEEQSYKIIDSEWKHKLRKRGYCFTDGGYDDGGLYGRTWALFRRQGSTSRSTGW